MSSGPPPDPRQALLARYQTELNPLFQQQPLLSLHADHAFETVDKLGEGGMGEVYKVLDHRLGRLAALKLLRVTASSDPGAEQRFLREATITARLDHPAIPPVYEAGQTAHGQLYLLMRLIRGQTLKAVIADCVNQGRLKDRRGELLQALIRVGEAVAYAHEQGIVHRDLKPENIMVGDLGEVLVLDWGVAKDLKAKEQQRRADAILKSVISKQDLSEAGLTVSGSVVGTPGYMSPQQIGGEDVDARADVFALGLILVELLTGEPALSARSLFELYAKTASASVSLPRDIDESIPRELHWIAAEALEYEVADRTQDAREFVTQLQCFLSAEHIDNYPYSMSERALKLAKRRPGALIAVTASLASLLLLALLCGLWLNLERERERSRRLDSENKLALRRETEKRERVEEEAQAVRDVLSLLNEARALVRRGAPQDKIRSKLERALSLGGENQSQWLTVAKIYEEAGDIEGAKDLLERSVKRFPPATNELFYLHTLTLARQGEIFAETEYLKRLVDLAEERGEQNEFTRLNRAIQLRDSGDLLGALRVVHEIQGMVAKAPWLYQLRGLIHYDLKRFDEAFEDFSKAIALNPKYGFAYMNRGDLYQQRGQLEQALSDYSTAVQLRPNYFPAYFSRSKVYQRLGRWTEALSDCAKMIQLKPKNEMSYCTRGEVLLRMRRFEESLEDYNAAVRMNPKSDFSYVNRAVVLRELGRPAEAFRDYSSAIRCNEKSDHAYANRAGLYLELGQVNEAMTDLNKALALNPKNALAYSLRGGVCRGLGRWQEALADFTKALDLNPKMGLVYNNRARVLQRLGRLEEALLDFNKAITLHPGQPGVLFNRGLLFRQMGRARDAVVDFSVVLQSQPRNALALYHRGLAYSEQRRWQEGLRDLKAFLSLAPDDRRAAEVRKLMPEIEARLKAG